MTKDYGGEHFAEPQFLVFANRLGALVVSSTCILIGRFCMRGQATDQPVDKAPLAGYANPALSNILSSWCQYEALLFITFPVQVSYRINLLHDLTTWVRFEQALLTELESVQGT